MRADRRSRAAATCLAAILAGSAACARSVRQQGESMAPTIPAGAQVVVDTRIGGLNRGDIVVIDREGHRFVRRIVGLPGERIDIADGRVRVNGTLLDEPYVASGNRSHESYGPSQLAGDQYFVMGDNRRASFDSRHHGPIGRTQIWARVGVSFRMIG